eukprot:gb/GECH01014321.1/.p1 GENE.gb/GECH01014321.1/~~gb/GECH01014321.1/.p1  ORF type:complete len:126 (+),score=34.57 gb/GECH01014321.1/:1-378(+)
MNIPERNEFLEEEEDLENKIKQQPITNRPNAANFLIRKEDHTLGNIVRMQLLKNEDVRFAGYKMAHPLEHQIEVTVETSEDSDPRTALERSIDSLRSELENLENLFKDELNRNRSDGMGISHSTF